MEVGLDDVTELQAVKEEEAERAIGMSGQNLSAEPDFHEEEVIEDDENILEVTQ